jgi:hypothetical protein
MATTASSSSASATRPGTSSSSRATYDWNQDCCLSNLSALWDDNRESVLECFELPPGVIGDVEATTLNSTTSSSTGSRSNSWKQHIVFADESISNLILRNVLKDPTEDGISAVAADRKKKKNMMKKKINPFHNQQQQQQQQHGFPPSLNVVSTHILSSTTNATKAALNEEQPSLLFDTTEISTSISPVSIELFSTSSTKASTARHDSNPFRDDYDNGTDNDELSQYVFFLRPTTSQTKLVAHRIIQQLLSLQNNNKSNAITDYPANNNDTFFRLVFIPYSSALCEHVFWEILSPYEDTLFQGSKKHHISITQLHLDLIPLEKDLLSMELPFLLKDCDVHGTPSSSITAIARAILKLQDLSGNIIPRICGLGPLAESIIDKLFTIRLQESLLENDGTTTTYDEPSSQASIDTTTVTPDISALLIIDRKVDLVTPMLTPLTYEGLIDDIIGIDTGYVYVDESIVDPDDDAAATQEKESSSNSKKNISNNPFDDGNLQQQPKKKDTTKVALALNGSDPLFAEVRTQHVEKFGSFLQDQAKALRESHSHFTRKQDLEVIHQFVKQIPLLQQNLRSLTLQIHLAEIIKRTTDGTAFQERWHTERSMVEGDSCYDALEDLISTSTIDSTSYQDDDDKAEEEEVDNDDQSTCLRFLRLLCLQSVTSGGIKSSKFDSLRREVILKYGYETLFLLNNLEKIGALRRRETSYFDASSSSFSNLRKYLNLVSSVEVNNHDPDDISYVSSGYSPLSVRLVEAISSGWAGSGIAGGGGGTKEEVLKELQVVGGARFINVVQRYPPEDLLNALKKPPKAKGLEDVALLRKNAKKPVLVIFFVGGVTFMEIAALRLLSRKSSFPYEILCCTTKVVNGNSLISSLN